MYNIIMKTIISSTEVRKNISEMIDTVRETGRVFLIGRHGEAEAILLKFPTNYRASASDITNINAYSTSFDFLQDEPDIYSIADIKKSRFHV